MRILVTVSLLAAATASAAEFKAAFVDLQRAVVEVDEGKVAKGRVQALVESKQKEFDKERDALQAEKAAYDKQAPTMTDDARRKREEELQKKLSDFAGRADKSRAEVADTERKELGAIFGRMEPLLAQIANRDAFTMIFDKNGSGLAYAPPSLDVTNELIRMYNDTYKGKGGAAKTPPKDAPKDAPKKP
jgi:outer membrane protein